MRVHLGILCTLLFVLTGCGSGDHSKFVNACVGEGQSKKDCTCFADIAEKELSPEAFSILAVASTTQDPDIMEKIAPDDAAKMFAVVIQATQKCEIVDLGGL